MNRVQKVHISRGGKCCEVFRRFLEIICEFKKKARRGKKKSF